MTETAPGTAPTTSARTAPREVRARPPRWGYVAMAVVVLVLPGRRGGSGSWEILEHGGGTRQAFALYALWAASLLWLARGAARHATVLRLDPDAGLILEQHGVARRRTTDMAGAARLVVVRMQRRSQDVVVLLDADGAVVATPSVHTRFWNRADVVTLLRTAGVEVRYDTRRPDRHELEALYPGAGLWWHRHPVLFSLLIVLGTFIITAAAVALFSF